MPRPALLLGLLIVAPLAAQDRPAGEPAVSPVADNGPIPDNAKYGRADLFRQLEEILPTPNEYRAGSGAPGHAYWQQRCDYEIDVTLDEAKNRIVGSETLTYHNNSPDPLEYLWLQLDANLFKPDSDAVLTQTADEFEDISFDALKALLAQQTFDGGVTIKSVKAAAGSDLPYTITKTMMRVDLPAPLKPGASYTFGVEWEFAINNVELLPGRTGYEPFEGGGNIYCIAQWFPRMCVYGDADGWQHKQYYGGGEFALELGNYRVRVTAPADHLVSATGVLQNPAECLTETQRERLKEARTAEKPVFVVTKEEAAANGAVADADRPKGTKTWVWHADDVRDFAFTSSRKFLWDAWGVNPNDPADPDRVVLCQSFYPEEGEPLWSRYSTQAVAHTIEVYGKFAFPYPYPNAVSVNGVVRGGMEYPMICWNGPRPEEDDTYSARTKYFLISVVIHEVGHNWFPMIVNSDERQWTWMDEGLNTFLQYLAEQEWEEDYPSRRGAPKDIVEYMRSTDQVPIMTNSESLLQFGPNAYSKPCTALNILRETVMGRELFDKAFKTYATRWRFKHPKPADFFRTMEDAGGVDLDWFWRGWFYTTAHVDLAISNLRVATIDPGDPVDEEQRGRREKEGEPESLSAGRNEELPKRVDEYAELLDFYNDYDPLKATEKQIKTYREFLDKLSDDEARLLKNDTRFYAVDITNEGGLPMPVILKLTFADGSNQELRIPAEIWRQDARKVTKVMLLRKELKKLELDPHLETADTDLSDNVLPRELVESRFKLFQKKAEEENPMQAATKAAEEKAKEKPAADSTTPADGKVVEPVRTQQVDD